MKPKLISPLQVRHIAALIYSGKFTEREIAKMTGSRMETVIQVKGYLVNLPERKQVEKDTKGIKDGQMSNDGADGKRRTKS